MKPIAKLLLGSQSQSRQFLLTEMGVPYVLIPQDADEKKCNWDLPLPKLVEEIALFKMEQLILPIGVREGDYAFVLTADTLSEDYTGAIQGKPIDLVDAIMKIRKARQGSRLCTSFCLDKRMWTMGKWELIMRVQQSVGAEYYFDVPDSWIDSYLANSLALSCSNAVAIEKFGAQFLKIVKGSYTTIVGLPLFELREALEIVGFFKK